MGDNRIGHGGRNHLFEVGPNVNNSSGSGSGGNNNHTHNHNKIDLFLRSESPRVQQILLHQKLREEIEKNSNNRVRYIDSELYLRNHERSPAHAGSEVQSTTLNIGIPSSTTAPPATAARQPSGAGGGSSRIPINSMSSIVRDDKPLATTTTTTKNDATIAMDSSDSISDTRGQHKREPPNGLSSNRNCQVCLLKEARQDLVNLNKMIQERNVHFSELKAKCLRTYFKRQMG